MREIAPRRQASFSRLRATTRQCLQLNLHLITPATARLIADRPAGSTEKRCYLFAKLFFRWWEAPWIWKLLYGLKRGGFVFSQRNLNTVISKNTHAFILLYVLKDCGKRNIHIHNKYIITCISFIIICRAIKNLLKREKVYSRNIMKHRHNHHKDNVWKLLQNECSKLSITRVEHDSCGRVISHLCDATFTEEVAVGVQTWGDKVARRQGLERRLRTSALCRGHGAVNHRW